MRADAADTPWAVASRMFSAFATSAIFRAPSAGESTTGVFESTPQEQPADPTAAEETRTGRILPSLLPVNRFEVASGEEDGPVQRAVRAKRPRQRAVAVAEQQEASEPTEVTADPAMPPTIAPEVNLAATPSPRHARKPNRLGADARVRAGEGWKRRRLPKACW